MKKLFNCKDLAQKQSILWKMKFNKNDEKCYEKKLS